MNILAIESSCDETAVAIISAKNKKIEILANIIFSQIAIHKKYFGVYPELASRAHLEKILPVFQEALKKSRLQMKDIDAIAVTVGPGLIGSLLVGVNFAKTLSYVYQKPVIAVNHLEGHIYANFVGDVKTKSANVKANNQKPEFPALCLIVSGGHTLLALMKDHLKYKIIGETLDDAAGEAFDKVAKILGLGYPGGPEIEKIIKKSQISNLKSQNLILPRSMIDSKDFNFSFSGLKTAVLYLTKKIDIKKHRAEIAAEFQQAVVDILVAKTLKAAQKYKVKTIILSGGVAANSRLRSELKSQVSHLQTNFFVPQKNLCTDNALGIAVAGYYKILANKVGKWYNLTVNANLKLGE